MPLALRRLRRVAPLLALAVVLTVAGCDSDDTDESTDVTVMSYNLYLGGDIFDLVGTEPQQLPAVAARLYADVVATDFAARANAIAAIIEAEAPDLIGLQEVTLYRLQTPSDFDFAAGVGGNPPNAEDVSFDFLELLLNALEDRGLDYTVRAMTTNADVEVPTTTDGQSFTDIRLTDHDVILAREGVTTRGAVEANFDVAAPVPVGGSAIPFYRGYNSVTATVDDVTFTFANAHLEVDDRDPQGAARAQTAQAAELVLALRGAPEPVVLVGDFNSAADGSGTVTPDFNTTTYGLLTNTYTDAFGSAEAPTCCQAADLLNMSSELDSRIDLILYRGDVEVVSTEVVGDERVNLGGPQWPSDHAGVVATLRIEG